VGEKRGRAEELSPFLSSRKVWVMKKAIIVIIILLCTTAPAYAGFNWGAKKTFTVGTKKTIVIAEKYLTTEGGRSLVKTVVKRGLGSGGSVRLVHPLVGIITTAVGAYYLYNDFSGLVTELETDPKIWDPGTRVEKLIANGHTYEVRLGAKSQVYYPWNGVYVVCDPNSISCQYPTYYTATTEAYKLIICFDGDCQESMWVTPSFTLNWINNTGDQNPTKTKTKSLNEPYIDSIIDGKTEEQIDTSVVRDIIPESEVTSSDEESTSIEPKLYEIEDPEGTDPATDEPHETEVEPGTEQDTMSVPGYPAVPTLDTTIEEPDKKSIPDLISGWLSNAPFMAIISDMEVKATGGQSEFIIPLPEILGGTATMDFGEWSDLWQAMGAIIIAIAYIYGAMIIFGGKS